MVSSSTLGGGGLGGPPPPSYDHNEILDTEAAASGDLPSYMTGSTVEVVPCSSTNIYEPVIAVVISPNPISISTTTAPSLITSRSSVISTSSSTITPSTSVPVAAAGSASKIPSTSYKDVGDILTGKVYITPQKDMEFGYLIVDAIGEEMTIRQKGYSENQYRRVFTLGRYDIPQQALPEGNMLLKGLRYSFSFSLVIPEKIPHEKCPCGGRTHDELPPSFGTRSEQLTIGPDDISEQCAKILYRVRARLYKPLHLLNNDNRVTSPVKIWAKGSRSFTLRPSLYLPPNLENLTDKNGISLRLPNYFSQKKLHQGILLKRSEIGTVELRISDQLNINLNNPRNTSVVMLDIIYTPTNILTCSAVTPLEINNVSYSVNALTYAGSEAMVHPPSRSSILTKSSVKSSIHLAVDNLFRQKLTISKPDWRLNDKSGDSQIQAIPSYLTSLTLPFLFPATNPKVVATYFSCLTSRQYELNVNVGLGRGFGSHSITIPILVTNYNPHRFSLSSSSTYGQDFEEIAIQSHHSSLGGDREHNNSNSNSTISGDDGGNSVGGGHVAPSYQESLDSTDASLDTELSSQRSNRQHVSLGIGARQLVRSCEKAASLLTII